MIKLKDVVDIELFKNDLERGMISEYNYDEYAVYCYSRKAQYEGYWNPKTTLVTRGLVVKKINGDLSSAVVIARGMNKFFTIEQSESDWGKLKLVDEEENVTVQDNTLIDLDVMVCVNDKIDGALGIAVPVNDSYRLITKGSFESDEAIAGNKMLHEKYKCDDFYKYMKEMYPSFTPLFEIVSSVVEHVIQYDENELFYLGAVENKTGRFFPNLPLSVEQFGFKRPESYGTMTLSEALSKPEIENHEGLVITQMDNSKQMYKIKYETYLYLQKLKTSIGSIKNIIKNEMTPMEIFYEKELPIPEPYRSRYYNVAVEQYYKPIKEMAEEASKIFLDISYKYNLFTVEGRKDFALEVNALNIDSSIKKIVFSLKDSIVKSSIEIARKLY